WLRHWLFYRLCSRRAENRPDLFEAAPLALAPRVRLSLVPTDVAHQPIAWAGIYEPQLSRRLARLALNGGLLIDVGANYGYFTCLWADASATSRVIAFEASPRNEAGLRRNVESNGLDDRVSIDPRAVGRERSTMSFRMGPDGQTGWGHLSHGPSDVAVEVVTLDEFCSERGVEWVDVLKVDVEGADAWVLEGARRLLREHRVGVVFFEEEPGHMQRLGIAPGASARQLVEAGYRVQNIAPGERMATCARRPPTGS
ncbi:MAG TPA: FkbM family methyltransferase, partial [Longimicrobiaceae bacterium]|nr:FkbM family methyltransferase [Longimicrobiaceae bacterium]